jgi:type IV pilus assembly protein PilB
VVLDTSMGRAVVALLEEQLVTDEQVAAATEAAALSGLTPLQELLRAGVVDGEQVVRTSAEAVGLRYVDVSAYSVNASAVAVVPADFARRSSVLPLTWEDGELLVAVGIRQAGNTELKDDLVRLTRSRVRFAVATRTAIDAKINRVYRSEGELEDLTSTLLSDEEHSDLSALTEVSDEAPVVRFVNLLTPKRSATVPPTSTSSPPSAICGSATASTESCTTRTAPPGTSRAVSSRG